MCEPPKSPEWVRGKILFNTANQPMTSRRWIACSSCHPDGHSDGRVWQNPEGLRKTPPLFGLAHTHPLHWSADRDEVQDFEYTIRGRLMQGRGLLRGPIKPKVGFEPIELDEKTVRPLEGPRRPGDLHATRSTSPLSPHIPAPGKLSPAAERGKALFFDKDGRLRHLPQRAVLHRQQPEEAVQAARRRHRQRRPEREDGAEVRHADAAGRLPHARRTCTTARRRRCSTC